MAESTHAKHPNVITECIIHRLIKNQHERGAEKDTRDDLLNVNDSVQRLVDHLYSQYAGNSAKGFGCFEDNEDEYPVQRYLRQHLDSNEFDFIALSKKLMDRLVIKAGEEQLATGGYVFIAKISVADTHFLLVAIVTEVIGTAITKNLNVVDSVYLDLSHLRVAGRINLNGWKAAEERYISFLKGKSDIADYFKTFIGCNDVLKPAVETKKLVSALETFAAEQALSSEGRGVFLDKAYQFIAEMPKNSPLNLKALANATWPDDPDLLTAVFTREEYDLSDGFIPDRRVSKALVNFTGKSQFWTLNFSREAIKNGHVHYNETLNQIILTNIPAELCQELRIETRTSEDDDI